MTSMVEDAIAIRVGNMYHVMACPEHRDSPCTFFTSLSILFHHHDLLQIPQLLARTPMLRVIRVFFYITRFSRLFAPSLHAPCGQRGTSTVPRVRNPGIRWPLLVCTLFDFTRIFLADYWFRSEEFLLLSVWRQLY